MEARRHLTDLPVKQLQYIFSPPGLPLPAKGESEHGTTSVLIRGGAGTGKTTFAFAIAHAIAKAGSGLVLYLTTEFSPVEIAFKATLIGLREEAVDAFPGADDMQAGDVVVEHLSVVRRGQPVLTSAERKRSSIDAIWALLHPEGTDARRTKLSVRSVVIDALTLPEAGESEEALRSYVVEFVQALESEGVSVVLVEELAPGAAAWSAFVVDVVFELSFQPDPETQELRRKLTLSKCRHALSIPGPHDYGLESGVPGIWPDLLRVITGSHGRPSWRPLISSPVRLLLPTANQDMWTSRSGGLVLSPFMGDISAIRVMRRTPGARFLDIHCGAITQISCGRSHYSVYDNEGPHAIAWAILDVAAKTRANACLFHDLEGLFSRQGSLTAILHVLESLRSIGFLVCVHGPMDALNPLLPAADFVWGGKYRQRRIRSLHHRRINRYRMAEHRLREDPWFDALAKTIGEATHDESLLIARSALHDRSLVIGAKADLRLCLVVQQLIGSTADGSHLDPIEDNEDDTATFAPWFALHAGGEWHAAHAALTAVESNDPEPSMLLLWKAVCAAVAKNQAAIDELKESLGTADEALVLDPLLRGLVGMGQIDEAERIVTDVAARQALPSWSLDRMRADMRLDSDDSAVLRDAAARLQDLTADPSPPLVHRAETWHNLGTAHERLGEREAAVQAFTRASELNPFLDAAREGLSRLASPPKAS
jgi:KaiC/GvpD/RAD55 family RecA-like ATPase/tetratricopeptide (TPR) repeat protein